MKKAIVIAIILLFLATSVSPIIFGLKIQKNTHLLCFINTQQDTFDILEDLLNQDIICYGYCVNDPSGQLVEGPVYFYLDDPGNIYQLWGTSSPSPMFGSVWTYEGWFCSEYGNGKLWKIDYDSGYMVEIGGGGVHLNGLAYGLDNNMLGASNTSLYEIDESSGEQTYIGSFDFPEGSKMGGIARDSYDMLYGVEYSNNGLYAIDSDTGETEYIGSLGIDINDNAFLDYCIEDECLYLSTYTDKGKLYQVDQYTGVCALVGEFQGGAEISAFIIDPCRFYLPNASFTWSPQNPQTGDTIEFNASSSYSRIGEIIFYEWDWNNDLIFDESSENPITEYKWDETGYYPVTLLVWDDNNFMDTEQYIVHVGKTLYVGGTGSGNYTRIQDAIDDANDGDTVFVYDNSSPYYENLVIDKSINLIGEDRYTTIIDGNNGENTVDFTSDWIYFSEFTIRNGNMRGIKVTSNHNIIKNNNIISNPVYSIIFLYSNNNTIEGNIISNNQFGLNLYYSNDNIIDSNDISDIWGSGIILEHSNNNIIVENQILKCGGLSIGLGYNSCKNVINNNYVSNVEGGGIKLFQDSNKNIIRCNNISSNKFRGIEIEDSNYNKIYHNNIINDSAYDDGVNTWDNDYPSGGNYWYNYNGVDENGDGIGDTPNPIPGGDNEDRYPFMKPNGWNNTRPNQPVITGPTNGRKGVVYEYNFSISDPDGDLLWIHIDWEHGTPSKWDGPFPSGSIVKYNYSWRNKGNYIIRAQTMDSSGLLSEWGILEVTIPRTRETSYLWLEWLMDRFPLLEVLILKIKHL